MELKMSSGYCSKDKQKAVEYIAKTSNQLVVKNAAERALRGEASLDSALVEAAVRGNQLVVRDTGRAALGME
jgi:hypothetical protein